MGNTLGAILFLGAATFLGWTVVRGRAQAFLNTVAGGSPSGGGNGSGSHAGAPAPAPVTGGGIAGLNLPDPTATAIGAILNTPTPNVFSQVFGQNGSLNGPNNEGPYGVYSPIDTTFSAGVPNLAPQIFSGAFGYP